MSCRKLKCKRGRQLEAVLEGDDSAPCTSAFDEVLPCRKLAELVLPTARFSINVALSWSPQRWTSPPASGQLWRGASCIFLCWISCLATVKPHPFFHLGKSCLSRYTWLTWLSRKVVPCPEKSEIVLVQEHLQDNLCPTSVNPHQFRQSCPLTINTSVRKPCWAM